MVVSLWQVGDASTADLMIRFYGAMVRGAAPAAALREAKLGMLGLAVGAASRIDPVERGVANVAASGSARPGAWAAFVIIGTRAAAGR